MRIEELNKDLKHAYQTMVETVEELVVKDFPKRHPGTTSLLQWVKPLTKLLISMLLKLHLRRIMK